MSTQQDSLARQQFSMNMSSLLQSLRIACSFTVFPSVRFGVLNWPLFAFKFQPLPRRLGVIDCRLFSNTPLAKCYRTWLVLSSVIAADAYIPVHMKPAQITGDNFLSFSRSATLQICNASCTGNYIITNSVITVILAVGFAPWLLRTVLRR